MDGCGFVIGNLRALFFLPFTLGGLLVEWVRCKLTGKEFLEIEKKELTESRR